MSNYFSSFANDVFMACKFRQFISSSHDLAGMDVALEVIKEFLKTGFESPAAPQSFEDLTASRCGFHTRVLFLFIVWGETSELWVLSFFFSHIPSYFVVH
jgi:hypothetical protein